MDTLPDLPFTEVDHEREHPPSLANVDQMSPWIQS